MEYHENLTPAEMGRGIPEDAPDIAGEDITPERVAAVVGEDAAAEALPWVAEGREPTTDEKIDVLAGTVEYLDGQLAEVREACSQMARVLVRLVRAVDDADPNRPARVYGPDGQPLNRKQRRDIEFGRSS